MPSPYQQLCNDLFAFQRQPQQAAEDPHAAARAFLSDPAVRTWVDPVCTCWFPHNVTKITLADTQPAVDALTESGQRRYVAYWVDAHGLALLLTALPDSDAQRDTHLELAALCVAVPNAAAMCEASGVCVAYPSYERTWRVRRDRWTRGFLKQLEALAVEPLPSAVPTRDKGEETYTEPRNVVEARPALEALLCLLEAEPLDTAHPSAFTPVTKTVHARVEWNDAKLPGRRAWSWLACKALLRVVVPERVYKMGMLAWMVAVLDSDQCADLTMEHRIEAYQKVARRARKLNVEVPRKVQALVAEADRDWRRSASNTDVPDHTTLSSLSSTLAQDAAVAWGEQSCGQPAKAPPLPTATPSKAMGLYRPYEKVVAAMVRKEGFCEETALAASVSPSDACHDPEMYSRQVLIRLAQLRHRHKRACTHDPQLRDHRIELDPRLFERLVLPTEAEMRACHIVETYFRRFVDASRDHVLSPGLSRDTYAYRYVQSHGAHYDDLERRLTECDEARCEAKRVEVKRWLAECQRRTANAHSSKEDYSNCKCGWYLCSRCKDYQWLSMEVPRESPPTVHEKLLPRDDLLRTHVLFECALPKDYAAFRDELYTLQTDWTSGRVQPVHEKAQENSRRTSQVTYDFVTRSTVTSVAQQSQCTATIRARRWRTRPCAASTTFSTSRIRWTASWLAGTRGTSPRRRLIRLRTTRKPWW